MDDRESDTSSTENGNVGSLLNLGGHTGSTVASGDTAAEQTGSVHGSIRLDGDDRDVSEDSVLRKGGGAHKVQDFLALALEAAGAVGHDTLALGGADLSAKVSLARLAELAFLAFGCARGREGRSV